MAAATASERGSADASYLASLLGSTLHLYTADGRMFAGEFKCTDKDRNIILARTLEYRMPGPRAVRAAATGGASAAAAPTAEDSRGPSANDEFGGAEVKEERPTVVVEATSRFVGLVVVPGEWITRIEVEER